MKIYILAQGKGSRWEGENLPSEYKQLMPMGNGELLVHRTIRQIADAPNGVTLIAPGDFLLYNIPKWVDFRSFHEPTGCILEGICRTKKEWEGHRVTFLLGDVVYSNRMMQEIFSNNDTVSFFGREGANVFIGKEAKEIFAFSFNENHVIQQALWEDMRDMWFHKQIQAKLWHFCDRGELHTLDNDYTDDIDGPEEYNLFYEKLKELALADDKRRI